MTWPGLRAGLKNYEKVPVWQVLRLKVRIFTNSRTFCADMRPRMGKYLAKILAKA